MVMGLGNFSWTLKIMLGEYIVAHPESVDCIVEEAELCLDPPSELLLLLLLSVQLLQITNDSLVQLNAIFLFTKIAKIKSGFSVRVV